MRNVIGIRREDLDKRGEQRVAIVPNNVSSLSEIGFPFLVQPGIHPETGEVKRSFPDSDYEDAGADIEENLQHADIIFGLKEIKPESILENKAYLIFSHTHKGQVKNMSMLSEFVKKQATLIDYELITDEEEKRILTSFTYFAGYAGMVDSLWTLGKRLSILGFHNPFSKIPQSIEKADLGAIKQILYEVGSEIKEHGTPEELPPVVVAFCGKGKTSAGAQEMLDNLPVKEIEVDELEEVLANGSRKHIYKVLLGIRQMYRLKSEYKEKGENLEKKEWVQLYMDQPDLFESNLDQVYQYTTCLMNCILWSPVFPRLLTRDWVAENYSPDQTLKVIGDITCDPEGAIHFSKETWIDDPVYIYDPVERIQKDGFEGNGIAVMAVTNLPCEFSSDASTRFSQELAPFLPAIFLANYQEDSIEKAGLPPEIQKATVLWKGKFTSPYRYMEEFIKTW